MHLFGHAVVAGWCGAVPLGPVALGAMLPDLLGRWPDVALPPGLAQGVALHGRTDLVFHDLAEVNELMRALSSALHRLGVARGPARGAAHVGIELLLDGVLAAAPVDHLAYQAALAEEVPGGLPPHVATIHARLRARGVPVDLASPAVCALALGRILGRRPRLAPSDDDARGIAAALAEVAPAVAQATPAIAAALRARLA